jgi:DNA-binding beta-propeller fold protein YncE
LFWPDGGDPGDPDGGPDDDGDAAFPMADAGGAPFDGGAEMPDANIPPLPEFVNHWGGYGTEPGLFVEPSSVELNSEGVVIVAGHENRVQRFSMDGVLLDIFGEAGAGDGQFNHPHGLAVDRQRGDLLYVGDQNNHRLQVFTNDTTFVRQWGDDQFRHIHDVGIDQASGDLFVGDYELDTVRKFSPTGELLATFGGTGNGAGQFNGVWGISTDSGGFVYVADTFNRRLQKLNADGFFIDMWFSWADFPFQKPTGVFVDAEDRVYLCDSTAEAVYVFDSVGNPLQRWDLASIYGEPSEPEDIVMDANGVHIFIAEVFQHRVLHFQRPQ